MKKFFIAALGFILFQSCSPTEQVEFHSGTITLTAMGPLFEGSNTATFEWDIDMLKMVSGLEDVNDIKKARLTEITISIEDAALVENLTIQLASKNYGMQKVGFMDAVQNVQVADKQENLASFFQDEYPTVVADFNILEDYYDDFVIEAELMFELTLTAKK
ncbi:MAG: hypothetical protein JJU02_11460 [Cryomorphaceae bacterium]|nr:hypothetical protein [Cryomorphaceae bacterium]